MTQKNPRRDLNQLAKSIVDQATREAQAPVTEPASKRGAIGGVARAKKMTPEERADTARLAATVRWKKSN